MEEVEAREQGDIFEILISFSPRLLSIDASALLFKTTSFEKERDGLMLIFLLFLIKLFFYKFLFINKKY